MEKIVSTEGIQEKEEDVQAKEKKEEPSLSYLAVFLFLRQNEGYHDFEEIAEGTGLDVEKVKLAVRAITHHPLVWEKDEKVAFLKLLPV